MLANRATMHAIDNTRGITRLLLSSAENNSLDITDMGSVMGEMKMGNIVPIVGIEPSPLGFWASVLTITPTSIPCCHHYARAYQSMQLFASEICADYYTRPPEIVSLFNAYNYIHTGNGLTDTYMGVGSTTMQHLACIGSWSWHQSHGCSENGKYCA